jgi:TonB family protein
MVKISGHTRVSLVICLIGVSAICAPSSPVPPVPGAKALATFAPKPCVPAEAREKRLKGAGVFILRVRPDGTVAKVDTLRSTGHRLLDDASIKAFSRWRFIPGSVTNLKVPVQYTGEYPPNSPDC